MEKTERRERGERAKVHEEIFVKGFVYGTTTVIRLWGAKRVEMPNKEGSLSIPKGQTRSCFTAFRRGIRALLRGGEMDLGGISNRRICPVIWDQTLGGKTLRFAFGENNTTGNALRFGGIQEARKRKTRGRVRPRKTENAIQEL